jgi:excisionase family DNA binding protein
LTAAEVPELLAVQPATVCRWVELGKLRAFRLGGSKGGRLRIPESALTYGHLLPHSLDRARAALEAFGASAQEAAKGGLGH